MGGPVFRDQSEVYGYKGTDKRAFVTDTFLQMDALHELVATFWYSPFEEVSRGDLRSVLVPISDFALLAELFDAREAFDPFEDRSDRLSTETLCRLLIDILSSSIQYIKSARSLFVSEWARHVTMAQMA